MSHQIFWPSAQLIPRPTAALSMARNALATETKMASGRTRRVLTVTGYSDTWNIRWQLTDQQYKVFAAFVRFKLRDGAEEFYMELPMDGGYAPRLVRFVNGEYSAATASTPGVWTVSARLEVFET